MRRRVGERGDAIVESMMSLMLICLVLFGLLQIVNLCAAQMLTQYAAYKAARAYTVGFADHIQLRVGRTAVAGASGELQNPPGSYDDKVQQASREIFPLPSMMVATDDCGLLTQYQVWGEASWVEYQFWGNGSSNGDYSFKTSFSSSASQNGSLVSGYAAFSKYPFEFPMAGAFAKGENLDISWPRSGKDSSSLYDFSQDIMN